MTCKLLEISTFYEKYLEYFYKKNPNLDFLDYNAHLKTLLSDCFAECDFIHSELQQLGYECKIIIYNDEKLQHKWNENYKNKTLFEIVCAQIKDFNPDIIYFNDVNLLTENQLNYIRLLCNEKCKLVAWHFTTINDLSKNKFNCFDQIYTGSKYIQSKIKPYSNNVKLLYHAFSPSLLNIINETNRINEIVFPGSIFLGEEIHNNRIDMFEQLYKKSIPCNFYGTIYGSFIPHTVKQYIKWILGINRPTKNRIQTEKLLRSKINPSVFGIDYYKVLNKYQICVNQHAAIAGTGAGNMRMFEATGMGACLVTDYREENADLFIPDEEIVIYHNYDELVEKVEYLIHNPNVASEIAKKGQVKTLNTHTYKNKAKKINEYFQELFI